VLGAFLRAAGRRDTAAMRSLLSPQSRARLTGADLSALRRRLAPLAAGFRFVASERVTDDFGLAAVTGGPRAFGAALRRTGRGWGLELGGPVRIAPLGPAAGSRQHRVRQIAAAVEGATGGGNALLYLDGVALPSARVYRYGPKLTIVADLPVAVPPGRHSILAFASRGTSATATAWAFSVG
jgi:hypothetical protein